MLKEDHQHESENRAAFNVSKLRKLFWTFKGFLGILASHSLNISQMIKPFFENRDLQRHEWEVASVRSHSLLCEIKVN